MAGIDERKTILRIADYVFYSICVIQMLLGTVWMVHQFPHMQNWQSSLEYLDISRNFILDEYVGPLYPALLRIFTEIEGFCGVPFYMPVYLLQLAWAAGTGFWFARKGLNCERKQAAWAAGYLVSFPLLLQFHGSIRPESFVFSGGLLLLGGLSRMCREEPDTKKAERKNILLNFLLSVLLIWLMPDLSLLVTCLWGSFLLKSAWKLWKKEDRALKIKKTGSRFLAFVLALIIGVGGNALLQTPGSRGRIQKTFWAGCFQRIVTDYFSRSYAMWDEKVRTTMTIEEAMELAKRSDNMMYAVGPMLEQDWGRKAANASYKDMALSCFRVRTKEVVTGIGRDLADACLTPFSLCWQAVEGRESEAGWNYDNFRKYTPFLAGCYFFFSIYALILLVIGKLFCRVLFGGNRNASYALFFLGFSALIWSAYVVMSTGDAVDYGKLMWVTGFYCAAAVIRPGRIEKEERKKEYG